MNMNEIELVMRKINIWIEKNQREEKWIEKKTVNYYHIRLEIQENRIVRRKIERKNEWADNPDEDDESK